MGRKRKSSADGIREVVHLPAHVINDIPVQQESIVTQVGKKLRRSLTFKHFRTAKDSSDEQKITQQRAGARSDNGKITYREFYSEPTSEPTSVPGPSNLTIRSDGVAQASGSNGSTSQDISVNDDVLSPAENDCEHVVLRDDLTADIRPVTSDNRELEADFEYHEDGHDNIAETEEDQPKGDESIRRERLNPVHSFIEYREEMLKEFVRLEGPVGVSDVCSRCGGEDAIYRCTTCIGWKATCKKCMIELHKCSPLHCVEHYDEKKYCWQKMSLMEMGLVVDLGHDDCVCPAYENTREKMRWPSTLTVLSVDGVQQVCVRFCHCRQRLGVDWEDRNQLLRQRWFPASVNTPRTVATFALLELFESLTLQGKISGYDFYKGIVSLTDNTGTNTLSRRYEEFMAMAKRYQHLKMLQRAGVHMKEGGIAAVREGELAVKCPACPHPGVNMNKSVDGPFKDLFNTQFVMLDANFHLTQKSKGIKDDPDLAPGLAYFVEDSRYKDHLKTYIEELEMPYCSSGLRAVELANTKGGRGYLATGVVAVQCKHMCIMPSGVGDLQRGERQCNVDYILLSCLRNFDKLRLVISYDIACQYSRKFATRMKTYPEDMQLPLDKIEVKYVIPMFHIMGHGEECQTRYSLHYLENMGRTDGENIERGWAAFNPTAMQIREMGSGSRRDVLNYHFGSFNWQRIVALGIILLKRLIEAQKERAKQTKAHDKFSNAFDADTLKDIREAITKWNADPSGNPDPYSVSSQVLRIAPASTPEDSEKGQQPLADVLKERRRIALQIWVGQGVRLEEEQKSLFDEYKDLKDRNSAAFEKRNNAVLISIKRWQLYQMKFMPGLVDWEPISEDEDTSSLLAFEISLMLPSYIAENIRSEVCVAGVAEAELFIRERIASDILCNVRRLLLEESVKKKRKRKYHSAPSQTIKTRQMLEIEKIQNERDKHVERYRETRVRLEMLQSNGEWSKTLQELTPNDVKAPVRDVDNDESEGRREQTWIWEMAGASTEENNSGETSRTLRAEWAKSKARRDRWVEEEALVKEEMRRVLQFLEWKANSWLERAKVFTESTAEADIGAIAHANRQAIILESMAKSFREKWQNHLGHYELPRFGSLNLLPIRKKSVVKGKEVLKGCS